MAERKLTDEQLRQVAERLEGHEEVENEVGDYVCSGCEEG